MNTERLLGACEILKKPGIPNTTISSKKGISCFKAGYPIPGYYSSYASLYWVLDSAVGRDRGLSPGNDQ